MLVPLRGDEDGKRTRGIALDDKLARLNDRRASRQALLEGRPTPSSGEGSDDG